VRNYGDKVLDADLCHTGARNGLGLMSIGLVIENKTTFKNVLLGSSVPEGWNSQLHFHMAFHVANHVMAARL